MSRPVPHTLTLSAKALYDGQSYEPHKDVAIEIRDGIIQAIRPLDTKIKIHRKADIICTGFVDIQINGANDVQFNDEPTVAGLAAIAAGARRGGSAHILPTYVTDHGSTYKKALQAVSEARSAGVCGILGIHLEGPFLSPEKPGIHPPEHIRGFTPEDEQALLNADCGALLVTLAPECVAASAVTTLSQAGITVFAGHTNARFQDIAQVQSLRGATHLFNAMSQLGSRHPGVVGAVLASNSLFASVIADGVHVDWSNIALMRRVLGDRVILITDAMCTLAGSRQEFRIGTTPITRVNDTLRGPAGTLAGAHLAMDQAVRNVINHAGFSLAEALYAASVAPLRALGLDAELGYVAPGKRASLTLLDDDITAQGVYSDGQFWAL